MVSNTPNSAVVPIRALLASVKVMGEVKKEHRAHFVVISVDDDKVSKSEKKVALTPRWRWKDKDFLFHPSSMIKIVIYRESWTRLDFAKHLVGQHTEKVVDLLDNNTKIVLKNKRGAEIDSKFKIKIKLPPVSEFEDTFKSFMKTVDDDIARLKSAGEPSTTTSVLRIFRKVFRLIKSIADVFAEAHPIIKASWTVLSAVYTAVKQAENLDDAVKDLAESLREMLGVAKEVADLPNIEGTTDVIEDIGRTSLKVASLIHEYTTPPSFLGRAARAQFSGDLKTRTQQYQKTCDDLTRKLDRRLIIKAHRGLEGTSRQDFQQHFSPARQDFQQYVGASAPHRGFQQDVSSPWRDFQHNVNVPPQRHVFQRDVYVPPQPQEFQRNIVPPSPEFKHDFYVPPQQQASHHDVYVPPQHDITPSWQESQHVNVAPSLREFQHSQAQRSSSRSYQWSLGDTAGISS